VIGRADMILAAHEEISVTPELDRLRETLAAMRSSRFWLGT